MHNLVIIGGGGAGLTAALTAKKTGRDVSVTVITKDKWSYSPCALPFVVSKEIDGFDKIAKGIEDICRNSGINCIIDEVVSIDPRKRIVETKNAEINYTELIIATGGRHIVPPIKGAHHKNIYTLGRIEDAEKIMRAAAKAKEAVVVGGGAIGLEIAASLKELGLKVTLIEGLEHVLAKLLDPEFSQMVEDKMRHEGIEVIKGRNIDEIAGDAHAEKVHVGDKAIKADFVVMATGVRPNAHIAEKIGIDMVHGGIKTDPYMETNIEGVYAAGDCTISKCFLTGRHVPSLLGTTAIRQGTVAGMNAAGEHAIFDGVLNSMAIKVFDLEVGRCGLTEKEAKEGKMEVVTGRIKSTTTAEYYPKGKPVELKLVFNTEDNRLIGAQMAGGGGVAGKINLLTFAISRKATLEDLIKLEYCYTPPLAPSHDPIVLAAENAFKKMKRLKSRQQ